MYKENLAMRLKQARKKAFFTQADVSIELEIAQPTLSGYENGTRSPDPETLGRLAELYNVSIDWLFGFVLQRVEINEPESRRMMKQLEREAQETKKRAIRIKQYNNNSAIVNIKD